MWMTETSVPATSPLEKEHEILSKAREGAVCFPAGRPNLVLSAWRGDIRQSKRLPTASVGWCHRPRLASGCHVPPPLKVRGGERDPLPLLVPESSEGCTVSIGRRAVDRHVA